MSSPPANIIVNPSTTMSTTVVRVKERKRSHYLITIPGILKIIQMIFTVCCFVRIRASYLSSHPSAVWLALAAACGFCITCVLFLFFCFNLIDRSKRITWILETLYCILWTVFLVITAIIVLVEGIKREGYVTSAVFAILAAIFYGVDGFYKCRSWMKNDYTFGDRHAIAAIRRPKTTRTTTTSVVTTPTTPPPRPPAVTPH